MTGATGVLGRPTVRQLVEGGHTVSALARSPGDEALLRQVGVTPIRGELFDRESVKAAVRGCEAVLHFATKIPAIKDATRRGAWRENDRIRQEGTRLLVDEALVAGVKTFVYPSVCLFYPDRGADWIEAEPPVDPPAPLRSTVVAEEEVSRFTRSGRFGIVLRMGAFYSSTAPNTLDMIAMARRGVALLVGRSGAFFPQIWVDDAATAVTAALERAPAGTYDVVDDEPLTRGELVKLMARAVGRRRLLRPPTLLLRLVAGKDVLFAARSQRVTNRRFKEATGWGPVVRDAREGWAWIAHRAA